MTISTPSLDHDTAQKLAVAALVLSLGTVGAYGGLIVTLSFPLRPAWCLGSLGLAVVLVFYRGYW